MPPALIRKPVFLSKPMDSFGPAWVGHMDKLEAAWQHLVGPQDTVVLAGDIDWSLYLQDAMFTLNRLHQWNGSKILVRGNHDYWWSSKSTNQVRRILPPSIRLIHNDSIAVEDVNICGCKGSPVPGGMEWTADNEKLLRRELHRLRLSLDSRTPRSDNRGASITPHSFPTPDRAHTKLCSRNTEFGAACTVISMESLPVQAQRAP